MKICILCGGMSDEKNISISSGRSMYHILSKDHSVRMIFVSKDLKFYFFKKKFIYSNTTEDFEYFYKTHKEISNIVEVLKTFHKIFPIFHGSFGEDGQIQKFLMDHNIPYIGESVYTCENTFFKNKTLQILWKNKICKPWFSELYENEEQLKHALEKYKTLCIKPNNSGSSIGVKFVNNLEDAKKHVDFLHSSEYKYVPLLEEIHKGREFAVTVVRGEVFTPIEIVTNGIFDYHKKYFPSVDVSFLCPPKFPKSVTRHIQLACEKIYKLFKCTYFMRMDGTYLPHKREVIFTDLNSIPGFEINSIFFKNKNHYKLINKIIYSNGSRKTITNKTNLFIIFGGESSENNISVHSGINVFFKLYREKKYEIRIFFMKKKNYIYELDYEEVFQNSVKDFYPIIENKRYLHLKDFVELCKQNNGLVFVCLHGGFGENGGLQKVLENNNILYTGSSSSVSQLCMNKHKVINYLHNKITCKQIKFHRIPEIYIKDIYHLSQEEITHIWSQTKDWSRILIKPNDDGCSVGVCEIKNFSHFQEYIQKVKNHEIFIHDMEDNNDIYLSQNSKNYVLMQYIETDKINFEDLKHNKKTGWLELTIGTLGHRIFHPTVSVNKNKVLTIEEKFLCGGGVNILVTRNIISNTQLKNIKHFFLKVIKLLKIDTYCRIDFFYNTITNQLAIIEVNTLPALTFATVLFQQAMNSNIDPINLLTKIIDISKKENIKYLKNTTLENNT